MSFRERAQARDAGRGGSGRNRWAQTSGGKKDWGNPAGGAPLGGLLRRRSGSRPVEETMPGDPVPRWKFKIDRHGNEHGHRLSFSRRDERRTDPKVLPLLEAKHSGMHPDTWSQELIRARLAASQRESADRAARDQRRRQRRQSSWRAISRTTRTSFQAVTGNRQRKPGPGFVVPPDNPFPPPRPSRNPFRRKRR